MKIPARSMTAAAALATLLSPLGAQRTLDADDGPIVRTSPGTSAHRAGDLVTPTEGQLDDQQSFPAFVTDIHTLEADPEGGAYGIWAAGKDYKVSFHDGATFVPYLGGNYPHNQPFRWTTTSVTVGGEELLTRQDPITDQASDTRYEYDHGGVIEVYDVQLNGLEQTFVIPTAPAAGDLVVRGTVETALTAARVVDRHTAIQFVDHNGHPILTYGAATAVDADGRRASMTTTFAEGVFELELDAAWLADASYPVVVDPLIGNSFPLHTWNGPYGSPAEFDVLREDERSTENVWICYTRQVSATDQDLWVMRTDDNLSGPLFLQAFVDITASWGIDSCALAHTDSRVICAFVRDLGSTRNVHWHAHHVNDLANRTGVGSLPFSTNNWRVDIGGNRGNSASKRAMVVFQHETAATFSNGPDSEVWVFTIDMSAATTQVAQGSAVFTVRLTGTSAPTELERPRINQVADGSSTGNHWCAVAQIYRGAPRNAWGAIAWVFHEVGPPQTGARLIAPLNGEHQLGPIVAGSGGRYLVTYAGEDAAGSGKVTGKAGHNLYTQRVDYDPSSKITLPHPPYWYLTSSAAILETGGIAYDTNTQSHWLVVYSQSNWLVADEFGYRGVRTGQISPFYFGGTVLNKLSATCSFDADNDRYVLVGSATQAAGNPVFGNIWNHRTIPPATLSGVGCSSANLSWAQQAFQQHNQRIGHEYSGVLLSGVPAGAPAVLGISGSSANVSLSGVAGFGLGCNLLIGNAAFFGGVASPFGTAWWGLPLSEALRPSTVEMQAFHLDTSASTFLSTQRLTVPIDF